MAEIEHAHRRASYGPTSPNVGVRGSQTRERIMAETLKLCARTGFQDTTVQDIADAADVSRAALYQYFGSKEEILRELLDSCALALHDVMDDAGRLGPTADGLAQLRSWIVAWSRVHERHAAVFVRWAGVDWPVSHEPARELERRVASCLASTGLTGMTPEEAGVLVAGVVHRYTVVRSAEGRSSTAHAEAADEVAVALQAVLFPATAREVLVAAATDPGERLVREAPRSGPSRLEAVLAGLSARSARTVHLIVRAGADSFAEQGYHDANVDAIVKRAGFARGTYYKYFAEKLDLLLVLADEFENRATVLIGLLGQLGTGPAVRDDLRAWVRDFLVLRRAYLGVMRALIDRSPDDPELEGSRERFRQLISTTVGSLVSAGELDGVVTPWGAEVVLLGALDRLPEVSGHSARPDQAVELVALVLERGLLGLDLTG